MAVSLLKPPYFGTMPIPKSQKTSWLLADLSGLVPYPTVNPKGGFYIIKYCTCTCWFLYFIRPARAIVLVLYSTSVPRPHSIPALLLTTGALLIYRYTFPAGTVLVPVFYQISSLCSREPPLPLVSRPQAPPLYSTYHRYPHISDLDLVWAPQLFYTCFYNHAHRLHLEKLLYLELSGSSNGF
jgi:hypothetical protein